MPDCRLKYQIILKRAKEGMGKFVDTQFEAGDEAIGDEVLNDLGMEVDWPRMSEG